MEINDKIVIGIQSVLQTYHQAMVQLFEVHKIHKSMSMYILLYVFLFSGWSSRSPVKAAKFLGELSHQHQYILEWPRLLSH